MALLSAGSEGASVSTGDVSAYLGVAPASVAEMLKRLAARGRVKLSPYHGARLTSKGVAEARRVTRKHRLLERFLSDVLLIPMDRVHAQACELEHALSDEAEESMCRLLKHPDRCPDDDQVIPACDLGFEDCSACMGGAKGVRPGRVERRTRNLSPLSSLGPGTSGRVAFIRGSGRVLRRLEGLGVAPGVFLEAKARFPSGRMKLSVGGRDLEFGSDVTACVFVEPRPGS